MPARPTVSAVLIVKDEEAVLDACLASVAWADEIVVYDTGSTDATVEIARRHTDVVVEGYWDDDFAAARNRALSHATGEWVLSIDADEVFEGDHERMRELLGGGGVDAHVVAQRNLTGVAALPLHLAPLSQDTAVTRVFRREAVRWEGALHEQPVDLRGTGYAVVRPLPNVALVHVGYLSEIAEDKDKGERNLVIAQAQLDVGRAAGLGVAELEPQRVHLARALITAGRPAEALAAADEILADGFVLSSYATILARSMIGAALAVADVAALDRWLRVWEEHDSNPAFALAARARTAAARGDAPAALAALGRIPTTVVHADGTRQDRAELVTVEVWALAATGDRRAAGRVARESAAAGVAPGTPAGLVSLLGDERGHAVIEALPDALWREYTTWCVLDPGAESRTFLGWMHDVRPGDAAVLGAASLLAPAMSLEEAAQWAVHLRAAGQAGECPLVRIAEDERMDPRQRALAGALAFSAYGDDRGLTALEQALVQVDPAHEAELAVQLEIVAPGLVGAAV